MNLNVLNFDCKYKHDHSLNECFIAAVIHFVPEQDSLCMI